MNSLTCPIYYQNADQMAEMLVGFRRLRGGLKVCRTCLDAHVCPVRRQLSELVSQAAREVLAELEP